MTSEVITTRERLRELYKAPSHRVIDKDAGRLDDIVQRFLAACPFVAIASRAGPMMDVSPKGDPAGFVHILDDKTLAIPDRPGNNRLDTLENLLVDPDVALLFLIPGVTDTLRINGTARFVRDDALCARLGQHGKPALLAIVVTVREVFMHCSKCMIRSKLWQPDHWPDRSDVPSLAEQMVAHGRLRDTVPQMQAI